MIRNVVSILIRYKKGMPFAMIQNEEDEGKVESIYKFKINKYLRTWGKKKFYSHKV